MRSEDKARSKVLLSSKADYIFSDEWHNLLMLMFVDFDSFVSLSNNRRFSGKRISTRPVPN